jgi:hypothetical protein
MNYQKIYDQIIERARNRKIQDYTEKHHVVPRSLGGSDEPSNIVKLTPREHLICHQLLVQIHKGTRAYYSMLQALIMMGSPGSMTKGVIKSSRQYEKLRQEVSKITRERNLRRVAEGTNPFAGEKGSIHAKSKAERAKAEGRGMDVTITLEQRREGLASYWNSLTPEQRSARNQAAVDNFSTEEWVAINQATADRTPIEEYQRRCLKGWETRKASGVDGYANKKQRDEQVFKERASRMVRINLLSDEMIETLVPPKHWRAK